MVTNLLTIIYFFLAGCENGCSGHGQCTLEEGLYKCVCIQGWAGSDCSIPLEQECHDDIDNDHGKLYLYLYIYCTRWKLTRLDTF